MKFHIKIIGERTTVGYYVFIKTLDKIISEKKTKKLKKYNMLRTVCVPNLQFLKLAQTVILRVVIFLNTYINKCGEKNVQEYEALQGSKGIVLSRRNILQITFFPDH